MRGREPRAPVVVGTAGHIDHGKTALVAALTGVATDRLPEERARGISIDLGFAPLELGGEAPQASIVDVPGHEGFIKNMVAGATGMDAVLFTVAADEGLMPQSHEHLLVLRALGVDRGVVAVTKTDLVEPAWVDLVVETVAEALAGTPLAGAPVLGVSSRTGMGIERLRTELAGVLAGIPGRPDDFPFRMPVDRTFVVAGVGTVATGTVWSGKVNAGETVTALPAGVQARVRSVEVHGEPVSGSCAGRRTALALAGPVSAAVSRGTVLVKPDRGWRPVVRIDAHCWLAGTAPRPLRMRDRIRLHHGTSEVMARVRWYSGQPLEPGTAGCAMLDLEAPIVPAVGDRFVLRAYSPSTTIGGGMVLSRDPPRLRGSARAERGERLAELASAPPVERVRLAVEATFERGIGRDALPLETGLGERAIAQALTRADGSIERHGDRWFASTARERLMERLATTLAAHHTAQPLRSGLPLGTARQALRSAAPELIEAAIEALVESGRVARRGASLGLTEHRVALDLVDRRLAESLRATYREAGLEAPDTDTLVAALDVDPRRLRALLRYLEGEGFLIRLASDWFADANALEGARMALVEHLRHAGHAETGDCKEILGVSRKYLIPILEYFDRSGITRREGNRRVLVGPPAA